MGKTAADRQREMRKGLKGNAEDYSWYKTNDCNRKKKASNSMSPGKLKNHRQVGLRHAVRIAYTVYKRPTENSIER